MSDYHIQRAKQILSTIQYATLATVSSDGEPLNTPVQYQLDANLNLYWVSDKDSQHSSNIRDNGKLSIVIYDSTVPIGEGEGVYLEATAIELNGTEASILTRSGLHLQPSKYRGDANRRIYKATPMRASMNDVEERDGKFIRDYRIELPLELITKF